MTSHHPRLRRVAGRTPSTASRAARSIAAAGGLTAALLLAGCSATNPIQTAASYDPSDGVGVTVGDVHAANLLILSAEEGGPGALHGALTNRGTDDVSVTISFATSADAADDTASADASSDPTTVDVPAGATVLLSGAGETSDESVAVDVAATPAAPGGVASVSLTSDVDGTEVVSVPVLDGSLPDYASLVPSE